MPPPSAAPLPPVLGVGADIDTQQKYLAYAGLGNAHLVGRIQGRFLSEFVDSSPCLCEFVGSSFVFYHNGDGFCGFRQTYGCLFVCVCQEC